MPPTTQQVLEGLKEIALASLHQWQVGEIPDTTLADMANNRTSRGALLGVA